MSDRMFRGILVLSDIYIGPGGWGTGGRRSQIRSAFHNSESRALACIQVLACECICVWELYMDED